MTVSGNYDVEDFPQKGLVKPRHMGTLADQRDMSALGRVQVLRVSGHQRNRFHVNKADTVQRNFRFISIVGFGCTLICTWEVILT